MSSKITQIPNKQVHDQIVDEAAGIPTIIYVSNSALPICKNFTPKYEELAGKYGKSGRNKQGVKFCQLELTSETSMMFKFAPNQLPVLVFVCAGPWAKTMMSPSAQQVEEGIEELLRKAGEWSD